MKAVRCCNQQICVHNIPAPSGEGVRVTVASAGICGSDVHMWQQGWDIGVTLGHEIAGTTPDGTAVMVEPILYCGLCEYCKRGDSNLCILGPAATLGVGKEGGMTEQLLVPPQNLVPLPAAVALPDACLVEPLSVAVRGIAKAGVSPGAKVAIIGGGTIGLCALAVAREITPAVHLFARHNAQHRAGEILGGYLGGNNDDFDIVIDCAGTDSAMAQAAELCKPGATIVMLASYWGGLTLPATQIMLKELRLLSSFCQARQGLQRDAEIAAEVMARNPLLGSTLITHRLPLEAAAEAFAIAADRSQGAIKVAFNPLG